MFTINSLCMYCNLQILTKNVPVIIPVRRTLLKLCFNSISHGTQDVPGEAPPETLLNFHFPNGLHSSFCCTQSRTIRSLTQVNYGCNSLYVRVLKHNIINNFHMNNINPTVEILF